MTLLLFLLVPLKIGLGFLFQRLITNGENIVFQVQLFDFISSVIPFILAIYLCRCLLKQDWQRLKSKRHLLGISVLSVLLLYLFVTMISYLMTFPVSDDIIYIDQVSLPLIAFSTSSLMAGLYEELSFRYVFLDKFDAHSQKSWLVYICSSVLFGIAHYFVAQSVQELFIYALFGFFFGWQYIKNKNIWYSITTHTIYNFVVVVFPYLYLYFTQ